MKWWQNSKTQIMTVVIVTVVTVSVVTVEIVTSFRKTTWHPDNQWNVLVQLFAIITMFFCFVFNDTNTHSIIDIDRDNDIYSDSDIESFRFINSYSVSDRDSERVI